MSEICFIDVKPRIIATGAETTVRLAGGGTDTPYYRNEQHYRAGVVEMPRFKAAFGFDDNGWTGGTVPTSGTLGFMSGDTSLIATLAAYYWRDAAITIDAGKEDGPLARRLTGMVAGISSNEGQIALTLADPSKTLDKPILGTGFTGEGGIEGPAEAAGRDKRRSLGLVFDIEGRLLDKVHNIFEFGDPARKLAAFLDVRDKGRTGPMVVVAWAGSIAATLTALQAAAAPQGGCAAAPSIACVKWWTNPAGPLTADVQGEIAGGYADTAVSIAARLLAMVDGPTIIDEAAADALRPATCGIHIASASDTIAQALDRLLLPSSLHWVLQPDGTIRIGEWAWTAPVVSLQAEFIGRERQLPPVKSRKLGYRRNHRPHQASEISAALLLADDVTYLDGTTLEHLKPAEAGATDGATVGNGPGQGNVKDEAGNLLTRDDLETSRGISADTLKVAGVQADDLLNAVSTAQGDIADLITIYGDTESAAASADAAEAARTASELARTQAQTHATNAGNSATAAAGSASTATTKATEAGNSATAAQASATTATTKASDASTSATNAASSATGAAGSSATAATQATNAANSATAAGGSATAAAGSASTAATQATAAGNSATSATNSANTAAIKAGEANTSAVASAGSAAIATDKAALATSAEALSAAYNTSMGLGLAGFFPKALNPAVFTSSAASSGSPASYAPPLPAWIGPDDAFIEVPSGSNILSFRGVVPIVDGDVFSVTADIEQIVSAAAKTGSSVYVRVLDANYGLLANAGPLVGKYLNLAQGERGILNVTVGYNAPGLCDLNITTAGAKYLRIQVLPNRIENGTTNLPGSVTRFYAMYLENVRSQANSTLQAQIALQQATIATDAKTAAQISANAAASIAQGAINGNPGFDDYPSATVGQLPTGWLGWNGGASMYRVADALGGYSLRMPAAAGGDAGVYFGNLATPQIATGSWFVLEAEWTLRAGTNVGAAVFFHPFNAASAAIQSDLNLILATDPDAQGAAIGNGTIGRRYRLTKLVQVTAAGAQGYRLYAIAHSPAAGSTAAANDIEWHLAKVRAATPAEIRDKTVLAPLEGTTSIIAGAIAEIEGRTRAYLQQEVNAGAGAAAFLTLQAETNNPAAAPLTFTLNAGTQMMGPRGLIMMSGTAWTAGALSVENYTGSAYASFTVTDLTANEVVGLTDHASSPAYGSMKFGIYKNSGVYRIYESNVIVATITTQLRVGDTLSVEYSGTTVIYRWNGKAVRTVTTTSGQTFRLAVNLHLPGARVDNLVFGSAAPVRASTVGIGAAEVHVFNEVDGVWVKSLSVVGGNALLDGNLAVGRGIFMGDLAIPVALQSFDISVYDGMTVSYGADLGNIPALTPDFGGFPALPSGQSYVMRAESHTPTGFIARVKKLTAGTASTITTGAGTNPGSGPTYQVQKTNALDASNSNYNFRVTGSMYRWSEDYSDPPKIIYKGWIKFQSWFRPAGSPTWIAGPVVQVNAGSGSDGQFSYDKVFVASFGSGIGLDATNTEFGVSIHSTSGSGTNTLTGLVSVSYTALTGATESTATPSNLPLLPIKVIPQNA